MDKGRKAQPAVNSICALLTLLGAAIVIYFRYPRFFLEPRFWAEEGMLHFAYSYHHPWWEALFQPQVGYLNFFPNLATILATLVPLETAPLVTTLMAALVMLLAVGRVLWIASPLFSTWWRKGLAATAILFIPLADEVWLNTINSYNYFAVITFLILIDETIAQRRWLDRILLLVGGLTGTLSGFLLPLFFLSAWMERNRERWIQGFFLAAATMFQVLLIFRYQETLGIGQRFNIVGVSTLGVTVWTQSLALFAAGFGQATTWARSLFELAVNDVARFQTWGRLLFFAASFLFLVLSHNLPLLQKAKFLGGYGILLLLPMMFSVIEDKHLLTIPGLHQRIFFAPNVLLALMFIANFHYTPLKLPRGILNGLSTLLCAALVILALFWGFQQFWNLWHLVEYWPNWAAEVAAWLADPNYLLKIQPENWVVSLQPR